MVKNDQGRIRRNRRQLHKLSQCYDTTTRFNNMRESDFETSPSKCATDTYQQYRSKNDVPQYNSQRVSSFGRAVRPP